MKFPAVFDTSSLNGNNGFALTSGGTVTGIGDVNKDGCPDLMIGSPVSNKAFVVFGSNNFQSIFDTSALNGTNGFILTSSSLGFGRSVAGVGDINGDGISDFIIGASYDVSRAFIVFGSTHFPATLDTSELNGHNGFTLVGPPNGGLGCSVAGIGNINGDSKQDLIVGAIVVNKAFVVFGAPVFPATFDVSNLNGSNGFTLISSGLNFGVSVAGIGDINGDVKSDFIVGAYMSNKAFVIFGKTNFPVVVDTANLNGVDGFTLISSSLTFGIRVAGIGDINGDEKPDFIIGTYSTQANKAFVVFGASSFPATLDVANLNGKNGFTLTSKTDYFGIGVGGMGDINGDGSPDFGVGAFISNRTFIVFGASNFARSIDTSTLDGNNGFMLTSSSNYFGGTISGLGDLNGNGRSDFIVSSDSKAYVIYGFGEEMRQNYGMLSRARSFTPINQTDGTGKMNVGKTGFWCKEESLFIGDFDGDSRSDLLCSLEDGQNYVMLSKIINSVISFYPMSTDPDGKINIGSNDNWCIKAYQELLVGDFNNDGKTDLLCHNNQQINEGYTYVMLSTGNGFKPMADSPDGHVKVGRFGDFCSIGGRLVIGNFDGLNGDDLLCNDPSAGNAIMVPHNTSFVPINSDPLGTVNLGIMKSCTGVWCTRAGSVLMSGHFNNDKRADLICNDGGQNEIMLASFKSDSSCSFQAISPADGSQQPNGWIKMGQGKVPIWCDATKTKLIVADIDGDNLDDLVCNTAGSHQIQLCKFVRDDQYEFRSINAGDPSGDGRTKIANYDIWCNSQSISTGHFSDSGLDDLWCNQDYSPVGVLADEV